MPRAKHVASQWIQRYSTEKRVDKLDGTYGKGS